MARRKAQDAPPGYKYCGGCNRIRLVREFDANKRSVDKLQWWCRECKRTYNKINAEKIRAQRAEYYERVGGATQVARRRAERREKYPEEWKKAVDAANLRRKLMRRAKAWKGWEGSEAYRQKAVLSSTRSAADDQGAGLSAPDGGGPAQVANTRSDRGSTRNQ